MKTTIEILTEMAVEESRHYETLSPSTEAARRFADRRDALYAAIAAVDACRGVYDNMEALGGAGNWDPPGIAAMNTLAVVIERQVRS